MQLLILSPFFKVELHPLLCGVWGSYGTLIHDMAIGDADIAHDTRDRQPQAPLCSSLMANILSTETVGCLLQLTEPSRRRGAIKLLFGKPHLKVTYNVLA